MAITISGQNNNDKILASDGVLDSISGFNVVGVMTAAQFDVTGKTTTNHISIGNNIHLGNAGIITATTLLGNVTGNINHTSNLLLQISGSEKFRVGNGGQFGIAGANYGTAGQVFTSGGSGSAPTWSTIASDKITEGNTEAEVVDTGSDGHFKVTTEGSERVRIDSSGRVLIGTTTEGHGDADNLTIADSANSGITIRSGASNSGHIYFSDGTSGADEYKGIIVYEQSSNYMGFWTNGDSEKLRIDSSGNFNLGLTASPVSSSTEQGVYLAGANSTQSVISSDVTPFVINRIGTGGNDRNCIEFRNNGTLRGTIGAIGGSNGIFFQSATSEVFRLDENGNARFGPGGTIGNSSNYTTVVIANTAGGEIQFRDSGNNNHIGGLVAAEGGGIYLSTRQATPIIFRIGTGSGTNTTERLRITSAGLLLGGSDAQSNTTLGGNAGDSFTGTDAIQNTLIGKDAGTAITSGDQHTAVGYNALKTLSSNGGCTAIGAYALEDNTAGGNTAVGYNAMKETVSGQNNTAIGFDAATNNTGNFNVAIGRDAMKANSDGSGHDNVTIGAYSGYQATKLYRNVIIGKDAFSQYNGASDMHSSVILGYQAGYKLGSGGHNVILGAYAMDGASTTTANQTSLSNNIVIGQKALQNAKNNTNGCIVMGENAGQNAATGSATYSYWSHVIAIGKDCLKDATGGSDSIVAIGPNSMEYHTGDGDGSSGGYTVAYGPSAFRNNRHIRHSVAIGNQAGTDWNPVKSAMHEGGCTFIGGGAGRTCSTGTSLVAVGRDALSGGGPCTGTFNTAIGPRCFERITSGSNNCAVGGLYTGLMLTTGDYNNFFGSLAGYAYNVNTTGTGDHNNVFGGYSAASSNNDHENIFGGGLTGKGANTTYIRSSAYQSNNSSSWSTTSDERIKKNIVDNNIGLDAIEKIRVRNFEYRTKNEITDFDNADSVVVKKEGVQLGVIAQEIKDILPDIVKQNTTGAYAVDPDNLTWYLVNAVKELSAEVKSLKAQINS